MKVLNFALILSYFLLTTSFSEKKKVDPNLILGKWEIYKIQESGRAPKTQRQKFIEFKADGTLLGGGIGEIPDKRGTWKLNPKTGILTIQSRESYKDNGNYEILKLTQQDLILKRDKDQVFMDRGTQSSGSTENNLR